MDKVATLEKLQEIRKRQYAIASGEVNFIHLNRVGLILAAISPLAATIGKAAGIPVWMMSNFGWDFIYRPWGGEFEAIADWIADCFSQCDCLFRLSFHEPMSAFPTIKDFGLTGGTPRYQPETLRRDLGLKSPLEKTILLTFGGLGLEQIPYHNLQDFPDWQFITFDRHAPDLPNLVKIDNQTNGDRLCPVDFMPVCGRVVSKPGFSTFSEACRQNVPIISLTRERFAESPLLLSGIQQHSHHRIVTQEEFFEGNWEFLLIKSSPLRNQLNPYSKMGQKRSPRNSGGLFPNRIRLGTLTLLPIKFMTYHQQILQLKTTGKSLAKVTAKVEEVVAKSGSTNGPFYPISAPYLRQFIAARNADPDVLEDLQHFFSDFVPDYAATAIVRRVPMICPPIFARPSPIRVSKLPSIEVD